MSAAFVQMTHNQAGWRETRKLSGPAYFANALGMAPDLQPGQSTRAIHENRANLIYWIDAEIAELQRLRALLTDDDAEQFETWWQQASERRSEIVGRRISGIWEEKDRPEVKIPSSKERLARLFTFGKRES